MEIALSFLTATSLLWYDYTITYLTNPQWTFYISISLGNSKRIFVSKAVWTRWLKCSGQQIGFRNGSLAPASCLNRCVNLGKSHNFPESHFPHL